MINNTLQPDQKTIEHIKTENETEGNFFTENHKLVYILKGEATFSYGYKNTGKTGRKKMIFLPMGSQVSYHIRKESQLIIFHLNDEFQLCECYKAEEIKKKNTDKEDFRILKATKTISTYMDALDFNLDSGVSSNRYFNLKINELLFLIGVFYSKKELADFFGEALYKETAFTAYVWHNHHRYNTVIEFAEAMNYTVSGFEKRFKKVFGVSPYRWMKEQKAKQIYHDVCFGKYNFKQIADRYNFASPSTFSDFYKLTFGETPGMTRKKAEQRGA